MSKLIFIIQDYIDRVKKILHWIPIIWHDWDSEGHFLWTMMYHKLDRMSVFFVKALEEEQVTENKNELSEIVTSIENAKFITFKLGTNAYESEQLHSLIEKWGVPIQKGNGFEFDNVNTEADKKQYYKDEDRLTKKMMKDRKMDIKKLMDILENDLPIWYQ
jgi:5S rRNA maturation endonuclease (ribonuclease M5)